MTSPIDNQITQNVRIPNLPIDKMVDENGKATPSEETFRQTLITNLQTNFGNEGCVVPSQSAANITVIQNNQAINVDTGVLEYTCKGGTLLYNTDADSLMVAILSGGIPTFKTVTVT